MGEVSQGAEAVMSLGPRSYDDAKTTEPEPIRPQPPLPDRYKQAKPCIACGINVYDGTEICDECFEQGRTCGMRGEMEE